MRQRQHSRLQTQGRRKGPKQEGGSRAPSRSHILWSRCPLHRQIRLLNQLPRQDRVLHGSICSQGCTKLYTRSPDAAEHRRSVRNPVTKIVYKNQLHGPNQPSLPKSSSDSSHTAEPLNIKKTNRTPAKTCLEFLTPNVCRSLELTRDPPRQRTGLPTLHHTTPQQAPGETEV